MYVLTNRHIRKPRTKFPWWYRAIKGGVWVLHNDEGWKQAKWTCYKKEYLTGDSWYHRTLISIVKIEEYPWTWV